jgi:hypothetical protein
MFGGQNVAPWSVSLGPDADWVRFAHSALARAAHLPRLGLFRVITLGFPTARPMAGIRED